MQSYGIFAHIRQRGFAPTRISLLQFPILSYFQFVTITDSVDVHYYLFNREQIAQQGELAQMAERSLSIERYWDRYPDSTVIKGHVIFF